ncbi:hypothetical protein AAH979_33850 [Plantactinospora sp. ZYX-F-223]|uniref:hypothetical protein n=1 Tax=Plantactinospora sp. ZYX-F-223 TaxID=3144103 RepID=UPI0031FD33AD
MPKIDDRTVTERLPDMHAIGMYLEYAEIGEPPFAVMEASNAPGKALAEYRHRLNRARRRAVRDRMQELVTKVDTLLPQLLADVPRDSLEHLEDARVTQLDTAIAEIE